MIDFSFPIMSSEKIIHDLEKSKVDFGLIETPERSSQIDRHLIAEDELVLAGDLTSNYWLLPESDSPLGEINENYLKIRNLVPHVIQTNSHEMTLALLKNGVGKTIISKLALNQSIPWCSLEVGSQRSLYFVTRQKVVSEELAAVASFIQEQIKKANHS